MNLFHAARHDRTSTAPAAPWVSGHAAPEDRALGLELELIELRLRRADVRDESADASALDSEIMAVTAELSSLDAPFELRTVA